uniref:Uncharacterized protein n=1 Tax=Octopus bimaculoides TaxID=37653 RepID=A0A0L8FRY7_OCTBM
MFSNERLCITEQRAGAIEDLASEKCICNESGTLTLINEKKTKEQRCYYKIRLNTLEVFENSCYLFDQSSSEGEITESIVMGMIRKKYKKLLPQLATKRLLLPADCIIQCCM